MSELASLQPLDPHLAEFASLYRYWLWQPILAKSKSGDRPRWNTEQWEISPRLLIDYWQSQDWLIGLRPGNHTNQLVLDLDKSGLYCNPESVQSLSQALESIGLTRQIIVQSSISGGIHLIFPLDIAVNSFKLAVLVRSTLEQNGFRFESGSLESFPNIRAFNSAHSALRLPLQQGSYLLDQDFNPIPCDLERFCCVWSMAAGCQDEECLQQALAGVDHTELNRQVAKTRGDNRALDWLADLELQISQGWTGKGQTNDLIKRIVQKHYVFDHLTGETLVNTSVSTAIACPGFERWCNHQHEVDRRCRDWARSHENSDRYFPYGTQQGMSQPPKPRGPNNQEKNSDALQRLQQALGEIGDRLFATVRECLDFFKQTYRLSRGFLYGHKPVWNHLIQPNSQPCRTLEPEQVTAIATPDPVEPQNAETPVVNACSTRPPMKCKPDDSLSENLNIRSGGVRRGGDQYKSTCGQLDPLPLSLAVLNPDRLPRYLRLARLLAENAKQQILDPWSERVSRPPAQVQIDTS